MQVLRGGKAVSWPRRLALFNFRPQEKGDSSTNFAFDAILFHTPSTRSVWWGTRRASFQAIESSFIHPECSPGVSDTCRLRRFDEQQQLRRHS